MKIIVNNIQYLFYYRVIGQTKIKRLLAYSAVNHIGFILIAFASGYDIKNKGIALAATNVAIVRDLHCWQMNLQWNPYAAFATYIFNINVKASSLQDLKLTKRGQRF